MSKLRDRIRDISRRRPVPFGFAAMRETEANTSRQILIAAEADSVATAGQAATAGADVIIYTGDVTGLDDAVKAAPNAVVGWRVDGATAEDTTAIRESGAHFLVCVDDQTDAAALTDTRIGYVLVAPAVSVTPVISDTDRDAHLRSFRALDLDGVLFNSLPETMTVRQQLQSRRLGELVRKPLFVHVANAVSAKTLELWRDTGVAIVLGAASLTAELAKAADAVPEPRKREQDRDRGDAIVPAPPAGSDLDDDDDE
ncbi:MAG: hypothetical protein DWI48_02055 [Chloroflexi bacterium]|nr:MAG: hypothetical protein DWI48_02055 [Chloroflexota bacterium]